MNRNCPYCRSETCVDPVGHLEQEVVYYRSVANTQMERAEKAEAERDAIELQRAQLEGRLDSMLPPGAMVFAIDPDRPTTPGDIA